LFRQKQTSTGDQAMAIVNLGSLPVQVPPSKTPEFVAELLGQIQHYIPQLVGRVLDESLETEVERLLGRQRYRRRKRTQRQQQGRYCSRCKSHQRQHFMRNGHYPRNLVTGWGQVRVNLPQIKCRCGGNVKMQYYTLRPRQRIWEDVHLEIQAEYGRGLSYRQIKLELDQRLESSLGLRTLNQAVLRQAHAGQYFCSLPPHECPPVVRVDGIWITVLFPTGAVKTDQLGRKRPVKQAKRIPILAAQGLRPATGRTQLLAWQLAEGEDAESWRLFLEQLYEAGVRPEHGLQLLVADGSKGFRSAYESVYWQVPFQRCVFHKLRNVARAVRTPAELDAQAAKEYRTQFLRQAAQIWQAPEEDQARELLQEVCATWQTRQPRAIQTLLRDVEDTLTFYRVLSAAAGRGETWPPKALRTTSPLERMFREFRRRYRSAFLYHSLAGAAAATAQIARRFS
jgi:transposase-like protein